MLSDVLILKRIKDGDIGAFEDVFRRYYAPLYLYALSITNKKEVAEEIVQELFYLWWKKRDSIQIISSIKAYLYKAIRNQSLQHIEYHNVKERYRQNITYAESDRQEASPLEEVEYKELEEILKHTLQKLPERRLKIFRLHRFEGKKYKEIAITLSLSVKTVEAEMTKAYKALREEVEKYIQ